MLGVFNFNLSPLLTVTQIPSLHSYSSSLLPCYVCHYYPAIREVLVPFSVHSNLLQSQHPYFLFPRSPPPFSQSLVTILTNQFPVILDFGVNMI